MVVSTSPTQLRIPDLLKNWPWRDCRNSHLHQTLSDEELSYFLELPEVRRKKPLQIMIQKACVPLFMSLILPHMNEDQLRAVIRFAQWAILIDDHCEQGEPTLVKLRISGAINTFLDPDGYFGAYSDEVARSICLRLRPLFSTPETYQHFIHAVTSKFLPSVLQQAKQHQTATIPTIEEWLRQRYDTFALEVFLPFLEFNDPLTPDMRAYLRRFSQTAGRLLFLENDLYSYNKEQAVGDLHNTLVVVQHNLPLCLDGAVSWLENEHADLTRTFLSDMEQVPSFGSELRKERALKWISDLGQMVRGHVDYCFATPRYFKPEARVRELGWVDLLPKKQQTVIRLETPSPTSQPISNTPEISSPALSIPRSKQPSLSSPPFMLATKSALIISSQLIVPVPEVLYLVKAYLARHWLHVVYAQTLVFAFVLVF